MTLLRRWRWLKYNNQILVSVHRHNRFFGLLHLVRYEPRAGFVDLKKQAPSSCKYNNLQSCGRDGAKIRCGHDGCLEVWSQWTRWKRLFTRSCLFIRLIVNVIISKCFDHFCIDECSSRFRLLSILFISRSGNSWRCLQPVNIGYVEQEPASCTKYKHCYSVDGHIVSVMDDSLSVHIAKQWRCIGNFLLKFNYIHYTYILIFILKYLKAYSVLEIWTLLFSCPHTSLIKQHHHLCIMNIFSGSCFT